VCRRLLRELVAAPERNGQAEGGPRLEEQLRQVPAAERRGRLQEFVAGQVRRVLGRGEGEDIPTGRPLMELGMDSLMAVDLRNALGRGVPAELPATLLFDHPTVEALADFLAATVFPSLFEDQPEPSDADKERLVEEVQRLSQEEMESLINEEFARLKNS
jgi:polyketide synthase 12/myxalamid-type polyketide synthase MxaB